MRQHTGNRKKTGLHNRIYTASHLALSGYFVCVYHIKMDLFFYDLLLDHTRHAPPYMLFVERGVQKKYRTFFSVLQYVELLHKNALVTGYKIGFVDQVGRVDGLGAEAKMRDGHRARLFGVVNKITLRIIICLRSYDLDGVLVGSDGSVRTETKENSLKNLFVGQGKIGIELQRGVCYIIIDADSEMLFGLLFFQLVKNRLYHPGRKLF